MQRSVHQPYVASLSLRWHKKGSESNGYFLQGALGTVVKSVFIWKNVFNKTKYSVMKDRFLYTFPSYIFNGPCTSEPWMWSQKLFSNQSDILNFLILWFLNIKDYEYQPETVKRTKREQEHLSVGWKIFINKFKACLCTKLPHLIWLIIIVFSFFFCVSILNNESKLSTLIKIYFESYSVTHYCNIAVELMISIYKWTSDLELCI